MIQNNKTCILCKKVYTFCNRCEEYDHLPRWMALYCSNNCKEIFMTATNYEYGEITKEQAKHRLSKCDLSDMNLFHKSVIDVLNAIMEDEEVIEKKENVNETANEDKTSLRPKRMKYSNKKK